MQGITARRAALALAACAVVGVYAGPGPAWAQDDDSVLAQAAAVASAHWPASPCKGKESVVWTSQEALDAAHPGERAAADASPRQCTVRLAETARGWSGPRLCAMLEHEFGHLAGLPHSSDPADVMYSGTVPWTQDCTLAFPPRKAASARWRCRLLRGVEMTLAWDCKMRTRRR